MNSGRKSRENQIPVPVLPKQEIENPVPDRQEPECRKKYFGSGNKKQKWVWENPVPVLKTPFWSYPNTVIYD